MDPPVSLGSRRRGCYGGGPPRLVAWAPRGHRFLSSNGPWVLQPSFGEHQEVKRDHRNRPAHRSRPPVLTGGGRHRTAPILPSRPGRASQRPPGSELSIVRIGFVSTYPPRRCGIASFTGDLRGATGDHEVVALEADGPWPDYPAEVHHRIRRDVRDHYRKVARSLGDCVDVASIQHEYGIWGSN